MASILEEVKGSGRSVSSQESTPGGVKSTSEEVKGESREEVVKGGSEEEVKGGSGEDVKGGSETEEGGEEEKEEEEEEEESVFYSSVREPDPDPESEPESEQEPESEGEDMIYRPPMTRSIDVNVCNAIDKDDVKALMEALPKDGKGNPLIFTGCGGMGRGVGWRTLLHCACSKGKLQCVKALCQAGENLLVGNDDFPGTPLHSAIEAESEACNSEKQAFVDIISHLINCARDRKDGTFERLVFATNDFGEKPYRLGLRCRCSISAMRLLFDAEFKEESTLEEEANPLKRLRT